MKALLYKEFRSRSIPERALNGAKTERSIFLQVSTIVVALVLTSVATPIVESSDKLTYLSAWVLQEVRGSNVRIYNAAAFSKDDNDCSDATFRMRLVEGSVCITLAASVICTILLILEFIDKSVLRSAAVVSFILTFILILVSLGMMMMIMYGKICKKGSLAFSPAGKGYSFGPAVYCLGICVLLMVVAYLLLAMRRLHDRKRIREAEEYEEERQRLKDEAEFDAIAEAEAADAQLALSPEDDDENYTWQDVEELVEVTDEDEPTAGDWNALSVNSGALPTTPKDGGGSRPTSTADKYKAPPLGSDGQPQRRTKMVMQTVRKRVRRPKPKAPRDPNAPRPPRIANRQSSMAPMEPAPSGPVFMARPQTGDAAAQSPANGRLGIAGAHVAADLMNDDQEVVIDIDDDEYSVEEQEPTGDIPVASPQQSKYLEGPYQDHDAPAKPMSPAQGGMAGSPYVGTDDPQAGFVSLDVDIIDDDFGFSPSKNRKKKKKEDRDLDVSGWGDLDTMPESSAAKSKPVPSGRGRNDPTQADLDADPFPAGPSRAEKKEKKRKKRMAYNANDVYVYTSGGAVGDDNEFDFQDDFAGV